MVVLPITEKEVTKKDRGALTPTPKTSSASKTFQKRSVTRRLWKTKSRIRFSAPTASRGAASRALRLDLHEAECDARHEILIEAHRDLDGAANPVLRSCEPRAAAPPIPGATSGAALIHASSVMRAGKLPPGMGKRGGQILNGQILLSAATAHDLPAPFSLAGNEFERNLHVERPLRDALWHRGKRRCTLE